MTTFNGKEKQDKDRAVVDEVAFFLKNNVEIGSITRRDAKLLSKALAIFSVTQVIALLSIRLKVSALIKG